MGDSEKMLFESARALRDWLAENYQRKDSIWLVRWKKNSGKPHLSYDELVDVLMCYGWVDSLPRKLDDQKSMLRISPRNPNSNWSGLNKRRVERLTKAGLMEAPGMKLVEEARKNGRWTFLDDVEQLVIPEDLADALSNQPEAAFYFERFPPSSRRGILEWIKNAKQSNTRKKRVEETARKASMNLKANHPKGRDAGPQ